MLMLLPKMVSYSAWPSQNTLRMLESTLVMQHS
jgi:hypothetical protein